MANSELNFKKAFENGAASSLPCLEIPAAPHPRALTRKCDIADIQSETAITSRAMGSSSGGCTATDILTFVLGRQLYKPFFEIGQKCRCGDREASRYYIVLDRRETSKWLAFNSRPPSQRGHYGQAVAPALRQIFQTSPTKIRSSF